MTMPFGPVLYIWATVPPPFFTVLFVIENSRYMKSERRQNSTQEILAECLRGWCIGPSVGPKMNKIQSLVKKYNTDHGSGPFHSNCFWVGCTFEAVSVCGNLHLYYCLPHHVPSLDVPFGNILVEMIRVRRTLFSVLWFHRGICFIMDF